MELLISVFQLVLKKYVGFFFFEQIKLQELGIVFIFKLSTLQTLRQFI